MMSQNFRCEKGLLQAENTIIFDYRQANCLRRSKPWIILNLLSRLLANRIYSHLCVIDIYILYMWFT